VPKGSDESAPVAADIIKRAAATFASLNPATTYLATTDGPFEATLVNVLVEHIDTRNDALICIVRRQKLTQYGDTPVRSYRVQ
jgi:hypothetical protein